MAQHDGFSERVDPHNLEAEQSVLGSMLLDPQAVAQISVLLHPSDFYSLKHEYTYTAIISAARKGRVDLVTVLDELKRQPGSADGKSLADDMGGLMFLTGLTNTVPTTANAEQYARIVEQKATLRKLQRAAREVVEDCYTADDAQVELAKAEAKLQRVTMARQNAEALTGFEGIATWLQEYVNSTDDDLIPTGLDDLDDVYEIRRRQSHAIAGPPKMGKSQLLRQMALNMAQDGLHVLFISLEESQTAQRLNFISMVSGVKRDLLRRKQVRPGTEGVSWVNARSAAARLDGLPIKFDYTRVQNMAQIASKIAYYNLTWGVDVVFVDTQNAIAEEKISRSETTAELRVRLARDLDAAADRNNCAVIAAIQAGQDILTRDSYWMTAMDVSESRLQIQVFTGVIGVVRPEKIQSEKSCITYNGRKLLAKDSRWKNVMGLFVVAYRHGEENTITPIYCDMRTGKIANLDEGHWPWKCVEGSTPDHRAVRPRVQRTTTHVKRTVEVDF